MVGIGAAPPEPASLADLVGGSGLVGHFGEVESAEVGAGLAWVAA